MDALKDFAIVWGAALSTLLLILRILERRPLIGFYAAIDVDKTFRISVRNITKHPVEIRDLVVWYPRNSIRVTPWQWRKDGGAERFHDYEISIWLEEGQRADVDIIFSRELSELPMFVALAVPISRHKGMILPYIPYPLIRTRSQLKRLWNHAQGST